MWAATSCPSASAFTHWAGAAALLRARTRRHVGMVVHAAYVKLNDYVCVCHPNCPNVSYITTKCPALLILCEHEDGGVGLPSAVFDTTDTFARLNAQVT